MWPMCLPINQLSKHFATSEQTQNVLEKLITIHKSWMCLLISAAWKSSWIPIISGQYSHLINGLSIDIACAKLNVDQMTISVALNFLTDYLASCVSFLFSNFVLDWFPLRTVKLTLNCLQSSHISLLRAAKSLSKCEKQTCCTVELFLPLYSISMMSIWMPNYLFVQKSNSQYSLNDTFNFFHHLTDCSVWCCTPTHRVSQSSVSVNCFYFGN